MNKLALMSKSKWNWLLVATMLVMGLIGYLIADARAADVVYSGTRGTSKRLKDMGDTTHAPVRFIGGEAMLEAAAVHAAINVAADTFYIIVDLSDTTNYPHGNTVGIDLNQVSITARQLNDGYGFMLGVINSIDGSGSTIVPIYQAHIPSTLNTINSTINYPFGGVDLEVFGTTVTGLLSADVTIAAVTTSTDLSSPAGTVNASVGDLLLFADEEIAGSTVDWSILVFYGSH